MAGHGLRGPSNWPPAESVHELALRRRTSSLPLPALADEDIELVRRTAELHTAVSVPGGLVCRNCSWPYPCSTRKVCDGLLLEAGLTDLLS